MSYPKSTCPLSELLSLSWRYYFLTLKQVIVFIVLFVLLKAGFTYLPSLPWAISTVLGILITALCIFLYGMSIYRTHAALENTPVSIAAAWHIVKKRIALTFAACFLIMLGFFLIFQAGRWIILSLLGISGAVGGLLLIICVGIPMILLLIFFYLTIPLTLVEKEPIWMIFYDSAQLTLKSGLSVVALYLTMILIAMLISTHSRHSQWLISHHLMEIFDWVVLCGLAPFFLNLTLFVLRNLRLLLGKGQPPSQKGFTTL